MTPFAWAVEGKAMNVRMALTELDAVASLAGFSTRTVTEIDYAIRSLEFNLQQLERDRAALVKRQHNIAPTSTSENHHVAC